MSIEHPKVSVCLMTYNGEKTVEGALRSLLDQTYRDYELIISDDHSTDATLAICQRVASDHPQVRFIRPEHNLGAYHNMRFALSHARGKYFVWASQDDYCEPEFLERLVDVLERSPNGVCAMGRSRRVSKDGGASQEFRLSGRDLPERQSRLRLAISILVRRTHRWALYIHGVCDRVAFETALDAHGKTLSDDRQIVCQLALTGDFRYVDQLLFHKVIADVPLRERRAATDTTVIAKNQRNRLGELRETVAAITRSPLISPTTKLIAPPILYTAFYSYRWEQKAKHAAIALFTRVIPGSQIGALKRLYHAVRPGALPLPTGLRKKR